jgi:hypothetical protein
MKNAGSGALARISALLEELRARPELRERRPGVFELNSRPFLHFHDDPGGIFADVRLAKDFVRLPVTSSSQQSDLLERVDDCLSAVESRVVDRRRRGRRSRDPSTSRSNSSQCFVRPGEHSWPASSSSIFPRIPPGWSEFAQE